MYKCCDDHEMVVEKNLKDEKFYREQISKTLHSITNSAIVKTLLIPALLPVGGWIRRNFCKLKWFLYHSRINDEMDPSPPRPEKVLLIRTFSTAKCW